MPLEGRGKRHHLPRITHEPQCVLDSQVRHGTPSAYPPTLPCPSGWRRRTGQCRPRPSRCPSPGPGCPAPAPPAAAAGVSGMMGDGRARARACFHCVHVCAMCDVRSDVCTRTSLSGWSRTPSYIPGQTQTRRRGHSQTRTQSDTDMDTVTDTHTYRHTDASTQRHTETHSIRAPQRAHLGYLERRPGLRAPPPPPPPPPPWLTSQTRSVGQNGPAANARQGVCCPKTQVAPLRYRLSNSAGESYRSRQDIEGFCGLG
jgi:hypothetical protein